MSAEDWWDEDSACDVGEGEGGSSNPFLRVENEDGDETNPFLDDHDDDANPFLTGADDANPFESAASEPAEESVVVGFDPFADVSSGSSGSAAAGKSSGGGGGESSSSAKAAATKPQAQPQRQDSSDLQPRVGATQPMFTLPVDGQRRPSGGVERQDSGLPSSRSPTPSPRGILLPQTSPLFRRKGSKSAYEMPEWITRHVSSGSNTIRVFFSSPFGGMEEERDILMKLYVPELRVMCEHSGLTFVPIDLRWGITSEDASDARVLQLCLKEIDISDLFVGFYGARYGWHGKDDPLLCQNFDKAKDEYPWIEAYRHCSLTEVEFIAGHFQNPRLKAASFYFRSPEFDKQKHAQLLQAGKPKEAVKFCVESEEAKRLRDLLKDRVFESRSTCTVSLEDYADPAEGAKRMYENLKAAIEPRLVIAQLHRQNRLGDAEAAQHETFANLRAKSFVGGEDSVKQLFAMLGEKRSKPVVVTGDHGAGKTSLLATWLLTSQSTRPYKHVYHFVGCSSKSTTLIEILQRLVKQTAKLCDVEEDVSNMEITQLSSKFASLLSIASERYPNGVVVLIDALDEMVDEHRAHELSWLPTSFPPNVKVLLSTVEDTPDMRELARRGWRPFKITSLPQKTLRAMMDNLLQLRGKELSEAQKTRILRNPACGNALFMVVLVTELCRFGDFFRLDSKIDACLKARNTTELYLQVLRRLEDDFYDQRNQDESNVVARALLALNSARMGLTEPELQDILGLSTAKWTRLFFALDEIVMARSGLLYLRSQLRNAVRARYLKDERLLKSWRMCLADHFQTKLDTQGVSMRVFVELPWLYEQCDAVAKLRKVLTNPGIFSALCTELALGNYDLLRYWRCVGDTPAQITASYMSNMDKELRAHRDDEAALQELVVTCLRVGQYLAEAGHFKEAMQPFSRGLALAEKIFGAEHPQVANALQSLARLCSTQGDKQSAARFYNRALRIAVNTYGEDDVQVANIKVGLAMLHRDKHESKEAVALLASVLRTYRAKLPADHPDIGMVLHLMGEVLEQEAVFDQALKQFTQALAIRERAFGTQHPSTASTLSSMGTVYLKMGDLQTAEQILSRSLQSRIENLGQDHPETAESYLKMGRLKQAQGHIRLARENYNKTIAVLEKAFGSTHVALCEGLDLLADMLNEHQEAAEAAELYRRSLSLKESHFGADSPALLDTCYNLAQLSMQQGDMKNALGLITRVHTIALASMGPQHPLTQDAAEKMHALTTLSGRS